MLNGINCGFPRGVDGSIGWGVVGLDSAEGLDSTISKISKAWTNRRKSIKKILSLFFSLKMCQWKNILQLLKTPKNTPNDETAFECCTLC